MTVVLNAANEVAVAAFLEKKIKFTDIVRTIEKMLSQFPARRGLSLEEIYDLDAEVRAKAIESMESLL